MPRRRVTAAIVALAALAACSDAGRRTPTAPDAASVAAASADRGGVAARHAEADRVTASARWNLRTREVLGRRGGNANDAARAYALVAVAQYDAVIAAERAARRGDHPSESAASAAASAAVLTALYPAEQALANDELVADAAYFAAFPSERHFDWDAGVAVGRTVGAAVVAYGATDGSTAVWTGTLPAGPGYWIPAPPPAKPQGPLWGQVRPWRMTSGSEFRSAPPPAFGSDRYLADLAEVHMLSDAPTAEQLRIAKFWAGDFGFGGPAGYFGALATNLAAGEHFDERRAARLLAVLHMAIMDASIGCYDSKYFYSYLRPYQDPTNPATTWVARPNFPSYPSGHSCLSSTAGGVLTGFFPAMADSMQTLVQQAGLARVYAGLHFPFDVTAGQVLGGSVAKLALRRAPRGHEAIALGAQQHEHRWRDE